MKGAYYNEIDPYAAQWLRNLIKAGHIADGEVDTRSIVDVSPDDLRGFTQCHFFAGIGGWSHALRLAGWSDDRPIWTGSCPCQPFSVAGKGAGTDDPRHLWPHFHRLITACRPPVVMGEQVAGQAGYSWLDGVRSDLEREGYASRGVDIPACAVDAPHIRQRLYWVACDMDHANNKGLERYAGHGDCKEGWPWENRPVASTGGSDMADAQNNGSSFGPHFDARGPEDERCRDDDIRREHIGFGSSVCDMAHPGDDRTRRDVGAIGDGRRSALDPGAKGLRQAHWQGGASGSDARSVGDGSFWSNAIWLTGSDRKSRRSKPRLPLLAHGISNRVGRLRAYGNAIVPPLAAEVIRAFMETEGENT